MGVEHLWTLLSPSARQCSLSSLSNQRIAIDVSIWMLHILHGHMSMEATDFSNIHLAIILKRIVKLFAFKIRPVFVFDGKPPELKRQTLILRHNLRENRKINLKKLAEKFIVKKLEQNILDGGRRREEGRRGGQREEEQIQVKSKEKVGEKGQGWLEEEWEEEDEEESSLKVVDAELNWIVNNRPELIDEYGVEREEFLGWDFLRQNNFLRMIKLKELEKTQLKFEQIDSIEEFSKTQVKEYLSHINQKNSIEKSRLEILSLKNENEKQKIIENTTKSSVLSSYLQNIEKNKVTVGKDLKDSSQGFLIIKKVDEEVERLKRMVLNIPKKKRITKDEKLKSIEVKLEEMLKEREKVEEEQKDEKEGGNKKDEERREIEGEKNSEIMEESEKRSRNEKKERREEKEGGRIDENQELIREDDGETKREKEEEIKEQEEGRVDEEINEVDSIAFLENIKVNEKKDGKNITRKGEDKTDSIKKKDCNLELFSDLKKNNLTSSPFPRPPPSSLSPPPPSPLSPPPPSPLSPHLPSPSSFAPPSSLLPPPASSLSLPPFIPIDSSLPLPPRIEPNISEEDINMELKRLENEDISLYTLEEQYQSYVNMNNLDSESLQDKFNSLKHLLQIMGIPYIDSPSEAEAQCAFLESKGLVDGIITEDSDVFLFGGRKIYRGVFRKKMESYEMVRVEKELGLGRDKLVLLAMFLGSDYTLGIKGVGIVNSMEIITAFDTFDSLVRFKDWAVAPDILIDNVASLYHNIPIKELQYKNFHKNYKKHWELPPDFPNMEVFQAYKSPNVDPSLERFKWARPDLIKLNEFMEKKLKWSEEERARIIAELRGKKQEMEGVREEGGGRKKQEMEGVREEGGGRDGGGGWRRKREGGGWEEEQPKIDQFFLKEEKVAVINSKRIKNAVNVLRGEDEEEKNKDGREEKEERREVEGDVGRDERREGREAEREEWRKEEREEERNVKKRRIEEEDEMLKEFMFKRVKE